MTAEAPPDGDPAGVAELVAARHRARHRRLLVAGVVITVIVLALGIVVVAVLGWTPGMARDSAPDLPDVVVAALARPG